MKPIIRNILAIIVGWIVGSIVNMGLVNVGHAIFPLEGINSNDMEALALVMPTLSYEYFIFPLAAHALGTFIGAATASVIATTQKMKFAIGIGLLFLLGGVLVNYMLPGPLWFTITDLLLAYIPMSWLGGKIGIQFSLKNEMA